MASAFRTTINKQREQNSTRTASSSLEYINDTAELPRNYPPATQRHPSIPLDPRKLNSSRRPSTSTSVLSTDSFTVRNSQKYILKKQDKTRDAIQSTPLLYAEGLKAPTRPTTGNPKKRTSLKENLQQRPASANELASKPKPKKKVPPKPIELPPWNISTRPNAPPKPIKDKDVSRSEPMLHSEDSIPEEIDQSPSNQISLESVKESLGSEDFVRTPSLTNFKRSYHPTEFQIELATKLLPGIDEQESPIPFPPHSSYVIHQGYVTSCPCNKSKLERTINKLCSTYTVLSTTIFRNAKIIDADIKCYVDDTAYTDIDPGRYLIQKTVDINENHPVLEQMWQAANTWINSLTLEKPFAVLLLQTPIPKNDFIVIAGSMTILDELSITLFAKKLFLLYNQDVPNLSEYQSEENDTFEDYSYENVRTNSDISFWRNQCVEINQDNLAPEEKSNLEAQLKRLQKEKKTLKNSLLAASKRRMQFEKDLMKLRKQRMAIEEADADGQTVKFTDMETGEVIFISQKTKEALIKAVLGDEAIDENIVPLLNKHDVPKEVQRKLDAASMDLEAFASLTDSYVEKLELNNRDKRQILALADYVKNRIKECIMEQGKVKFTLEREIAKASRGLETSVENHMKAKKVIDANEDMEFRLNAVLQPPITETFIPCLSLKQMFDTVTDLPASTNKFKFLNFTVKEDIFDNLRQFRSEWTINIRNKKRTSRKANKLEINDSSDNDSLLESDDEENTVKFSEKKMKEYSVNAVCLAAFGVLMRHVTGNNLFIIGVEMNFRSQGLLYGPLTDSFPVKIDLTKKGTTFSELFTSVYKIFKQIKRHGVACPLAFINKTLKTNMEFPVKFQFISNRELQEWQKNGFSIQDLLCPQENKEDQYESMRCERLWSINNQDDCDIKFIMIECENSLECGVKFKKDKFEDEKVLKWITKLQSTLEGIDCSRRRISISSMISRYLVITVDIIIRCGRKAILIWEAVPICIVCRAWAACQTCWDNFATLRVMTKP
ncbi:hypothetical protein HK103_001931 [Boothiomyces macroporosus]|uniref:Condensation domain-containing protein n=1 Tax=Boothiomyces macroporosus TaxID=261099 RepID=A0AAD5UK43_9FUNG|nr:hypothetical protein HK103_001931 [Boothiomyces macroporosus]